MEDGETGSTTHMFSSCGIIHVDKGRIKEEDIFDLAINAGSKDCISLKDVFEIITEKEDFYKIKTELEKKLRLLTTLSIEWRALNYINLDDEKSEQILDILAALEELDDVQNIFTNVKLTNL